MICAWCNRYCPQRVSETVKLWKASLAAERGQAKSSQALADPEEYANLFDDMDYCVRADNYCR